MSNKLEDVALITAEIDEEFYSVDMDAFEDDHMLILQTKAGKVWLNIYPHDFPRLIKLMSEIMDGRVV